jgi:hypothetical protein
MINTFIHTHISVELVHLRILLPVAVKGILLKYQVKAPVLQPLLACLTLLASSIPATLWHRHPQPWGFCLSHSSTPRSFPTCHGWLPLFIQICAPISLFQGFLPWPPYLQAAIQFLCSCFPSIALSINFYKLFVQNWPELSILLLPPKCWDYRHMLHAQHFPPSNQFHNGCAYLLSVPLTPCPL